MAVIAAIPLNVPGATPPAARDYATFVIEAVDASKAAPKVSGDLCWCLDTGSLYGSTNGSTWTAVTGGAPVSAPTGTMAPYGGAAAPAGYLFCDGSAVSRSTYAALFAVVGTSFGGGDGSTTFNVPNAKGSALVGLDVAQTEFDTIGKAGGAKTVTAAGSNSAPAFTGAALGTHQHGPGTLLPSAHTGAAVADHASHTHAYTQVPNHVHGLSTVLRTATTGSDTTQVTDVADTSSTKDTTRKTDNPDGGVASAVTGGPDAALSHAVTQPATHSMAGSSEAVSAGTPAGTVAAPTFTGSPTSVLSPYLVVNYIIKT